MTTQIRYSHLPMFTAIGHGPLMDPDPAAAAPAPPAAPPGGVPNPVIDKLTIPPTPPAAINLDTPVTIGGKTRTAQDILAQDAKLTAMEAAQTEQAKIDAAMGVLYGQTTPTPAAGEAALRTVLTANGWTPAQIEAQVTEVYGKTDTPAPTGDEPPAPNRRQERHEGLTQALILRTIKGEVATQLEGAGPLKDLLAGIQRRDGDAAVVETRGEILSEFQTAMEAALTKKQSAHNEFKLEWIDELAPQIAKTIAQRITRWTGDPRKLGVAVDAGTGTTVARLEELANAAPLEPPKFVDGMMPSDVNAQLDTFNVAALTRFAARKQLSEGAV